MGYTVSVTTRRVITDVPGGLQAHQRQRGAKTREGQETAQKDASHAVGVAFARSSATNTGAHCNSHPVLRRPTADMGSDPQGALR